MTQRLLAASALAALALMSLAGPASAHARLVSTTPPGGATVDEAPERVRLNFSERIEANFAGIQVFDVDRERVDAGDARVEGDNVSLALQPLTKPGRYTVVFRIISGDGHPVKSQFTFTYKPPAPEPTQAPTPQATESDEALPSPSPTATPTPSTSTEVAGPIELEDAGPGTSAGLWVARLLNYLAMTAVVGLFITALYLLPSRDRLDPLQRRLVRLGAVWAGIWALSAALLFVFGLSGAAARALPEALDGGLAGRFLATRFGMTMMVEGVAALGIAALAAVTRSRAVAVTALVAAALAAFSPAWAGHAGTDEVPAVSLTSAWLHVLAVTTWVGGLAVLAAVVLRGRSDAASAAPAAQRFSRLAGVALAVVVGTGVLNALLHMGALTNLWETSWGRLVVGKLAVVAVIAAMAWRNRNRLLPQLARSGDEPSVRSAFRKMALAEVAVMVVAFGLATGLASGIPADAEAASRIQSVAAQFGDGQINVTVDPAKAGPNLVHVYYLDANGQQREVTDPALAFTPEAGETLAASLVQAGPGHYTVLAQQLPEAGVYDLRVAATVGSEPVEATFAITVR